MHRTDTDRTQRDPAAWVDVWWLTPDADPGDVQVIADAARDEGARLVAHPSILEQMCRTASPFGPVARSTTLTAAVLGVEVAADRAFPEGLVVSVVTNAE